jgi:hypothetical protein
MIVSGLTAQYNRPPATRAAADRASRYAESMDG